VVNTLHRPCPIALRLGDAIPVGLLVLVMIGMVLGFGHGGDEMFPGLAVRLLVAILIVQDAEPRWLKELCSLSASSEASVSLPNQNLAWFELLCRRHKY